MWGCIPLGFCRIILRVVWLFVASMTCPHVSGASASEGPWGLRKLKLNNLGCVTKNFRIVSCFNWYAPNFLYHLLCFFWSCPVKLEVCFWAGLPVRAGWVVLVVLTWVWATAQGYSCRDLCWPRWFVWSPLIKDIGIELTPLLLESVFRCGIRPVWIADNCSTVSCLPVGWWCDGSQEIRLKGVLCPAAW